MCIPLISERFRNNSVHGDIVSSSVNQIVSNETLQKLSNQSIYNHIQKKISKLRKNIFHPKRENSKPTKFRNFRKTYFSPKIVWECRKKLLNNNELDPTLTDRVILEILQKN
ncbi:hypothetical protein T05_9787 [Trichinella murrelli]|uniref:Uncharacterized protein n=1 Tax=Trichinella murrelli TaxID=144512 RepID=A0A0V0UAQ2_9BILA|nr:hypothetical protein T05_9787 [Trichinella murrelli]